MSRRKDRERAKAGKPFRNISDKIKDKVESIAEKLVMRKLKNKTLDQKAAITKRLIPMVGVPEMRRRVIESIETDVRECIDKGKTDTEILQPCKDSPNYLALLEELSLNLDHIRAITKEARNQQ